MNDPTREIGYAINACAAALTPDSQIASLGHYFLPHASFIHPLCHVPSSTSPPSINRIIDIYLFYRCMIPLTSFEILSVAFDEQKGKLFVDLVQRPWIRGLTWVTGWTPGIVMHVHFWLLRDEDGIGDGDLGKWRIVKQEDTIQPMEFLMAFPVSREAAVAFWWVCMIMGVYAGKVLMLVGIWRPGNAEEMKRHT